MKAWLAIWKFIIHIFEKIWSWICDIGDGLITAKVIVWNGWIKGECQVRAQDYWFRRILTVWITYMVLEPVYKYGWPWPVNSLIGVLWFTMLWNQFTATDRLMRAYRDLHNDRRGPSGSTLFVQYNPKAIEYLARSQEWSYRLADRLTKKWKPEPEGSARVIITDVTANKEG